MSICSLILPVHSWPTVKAAHIKPTVIHWLDELFPKINREKVYLRLLARFLDLSRHMGEKGVFPGADC